MPCGNAYLFDIRSSETLLAACGAGKSVFALPEKVLFELHHAGGGKKQRLVA